MKNELYRLTDSFLVEATNEKGEHRSLERLNADRHLFVENAMELINRQIASAVEADRARISEYVKNRQGDILVKNPFNDKEMMQCFEKDTVLSIINPSKE